MSDIKFQIESTIHDAQLAYITQRTKEELSTIGSKEDKRLVIEKRYKEYIENLGMPIYKREKMERGQLPFAEQFIAMMEEISQDISILYKEHDNTSKFISDTYNYMHSEKKRLISDISTLNSLVGDLNLISSEQDSSNLYFKESFENPKSQDTKFQIATIDSAQISSTEGVLTLARKDTLNLSENATIALLQGNGDAGVEHLAKRVQIKNKVGEDETKYVFVGENDSVVNNDPKAMIDNRSDSIFEYQMVNVPDSFIEQYNRYDFDWIKGNKKGSNLRLKVVVELDKASTINWINVNPYYPAKSTNRVKVYSIRTSVDGFEYQGLFEKDNFILNKELNEMPETYRVDDLFDTSNNPSDSKFTSQGVWSFPSRKARFVEFVFDQDESYIETIGQHVYYAKPEGQDFWTQVPKVEELKNEKDGEYARSMNGKNIMYRKQLVGTHDGWRYAIGIRDLNIMSYRYTEHASFISQKYEIDGEIQKLMLYANEKIPKEYLTNLSTSNDWIKYEVTFDDINWYRISPMHQEPVTDDFPAKILEINTPGIDLSSAFQLHNQLIRTETPYSSVRFKVTLSRPKGEAFEETTPILEDVALRIVKKEDTL